MIVASIVLPVAALVQSSEDSNEGRVFAIVQKMESAFKKVEDYTCEAEVIYYQNDMEDRRYRFKFFFKRNKKIRVDFSHPYPGLSIFYQDGDKEATVRPLSFLPAIKFRFSIDNPMIKTLAGQRIDQTDMGYFIGFLLENLKQIQQREDQFHEDREQIHFLLWAMDYIQEKSLEKYRISISKKSWLPIQIERYSLEGEVLEVTLIKNYVINVPLEEKLFAP